MVRSLRKGIAWSYRVLDWVWRGWRTAHAKELSWLLCGETKWRGTPSPLLHFLINVCTDNMCTDDCWGNVSLTHCIITITYGSTELLRGTCCPLTHPFFTHKILLETSWVCWCDSNITLGCLMTHPPSYLNIWVLG